MLVYLPSRVAEGVEDILQACKTTLLDINMIGSSFQFFEECIIHFFMCVSQHFQACNYDKVLS
jgi:hypothetical protein